MSFTQSSQGTLPTREATAEEQQFITDILKLYQLEPSEQSYRHYADSAVFHDPVSIAKGKETLMAQFNGMPKIFARSDTKGIISLAALPSQKRSLLTMYQRSQFLHHQRPRSCNST